MPKVVFKYITQIFASLDLWPMSTVTVWKTPKTSVSGKPNLVTSTTQPNLW